MNFQALSRQILDLSNRNLSRVDFLREISSVLIEFSGCDAIELWLKERDRYIHCRLGQGDEEPFRYRIVPAEEIGKDLVLRKAQGKSIIDRLRNDIMRGEYDPLLPGFTNSGNFWSGDTDTLPPLFDKSEEYEDHVGGGHGSLALISLMSGDRNIGVLQLMSGKKNYFIETEFTSYERLASTLGIAIENQRTQADLRERVKELTCLYNIAKISERKDISLEEILHRIVGFIPPAWQYPEITVGRIILEGKSFTTPRFQDGSQKQVANIVVNNEKCGIVEVVYLETRPELDEGPFIEEERSLINTIAKQIALIVEQREVEKERSRLREQLRHADRLATIGQLGAGVAHELNEPLGNILGFAQLAQKSPDLPDQVNKDLNEIVNASIHAREVIKKLMLFARQVPSKISQVNLNKVVENSLSFLESRCAKSGIEVERLLSPDIPDITGDEVQLNQVLVNLVVNSIQAMADGGKLTIRTYADDGYVSLEVADTGIGIKKEHIRRIFLPFFTTKDVREGTGLGLAVVHGIVTSHRGSIKVDSQEGQGSLFKIKLPVTQR